jgi:hypothetical protein
MTWMLVVTIAIVAAAFGAALTLGNALFWLIGATVALFALWAWYLHDPPRSERSQGLAAALSAAALLFGAYWYMIERPGAAKLNLKLDGRAVLVDEERALVFLRVDVENVGNSPVSFGGEDPAASKPPAARAPPADVDCLPESDEAAAAAAAGAPQNVISVRLGRVVPLSEGLKLRLGCATLDAPGGPAVRLARADLWPPVASTDQNLLTRIEAGETESYYYRAIVPCEAGLVLSASARIPKRGTVTDALVQQNPVGHVWIGQSLVDLSEACGQIERRKR